LLRPPFGLEDEDEEEQEQEEEEDDDEEEEDCILSPSFLLLRYFHMLPRLLGLRHVDLSTELELLMPWREETEGVTVWRDDKAGVRKRLGAPGESREAAPILWAVGTAVVAWAERVPSNDPASLSLRYVSARGNT